MMRTPTRRGFYGTEKTRSFFLSDIDISGVSEFMASFYVLDAFAYVCMVMVRCGRPAAFMWW